MNQKRIGVDQQALSECENQIERFADLLNAVKKEFDRFKLRAFAIEDLNGLYSGVVAYMKDLALEGAGEVKMGALKLSKEKARELVELGYSTHPLEEAVANLLAFTRSADVRGLKVRAASFDVIDGNFVFAKRDFKSTKERLEAMYSLYAETEQEVENFEFASALCEVLNSGKGSERLRRTLVNFQSQAIVIQRSGRFMVNAAAFKRF